MDVRGRRRQRRHTPRGERCSRAAHGQESWKVQEHCRESVPDKACLLELGWYMKEVIVSYVECKRCGQKGYQVEENRGQGVISDRQK